MTNGVLSRAVLVFIAGMPADVFAPDLARSIETELRTRFPELPAGDGDPYRSEGVEPAGWSRLQTRVARSIPSAPHLTSIDAYQSVYLPLPLAAVQHLIIPNAADPLEVGSLDHLLDELRQFATAAELPTDEVEMMQLSAHYLEDDELFEQDLDIQTYLQLMLAAKQSAAHALPLWISIE